MIPIKEALMDRAKPVSGSSLWRSSQPYEARSNYSAISANRCVLRDFANRVPKRKQHVLALIDSISGGQPSYMHNHPLLKLMSPVMVSQPL